MGYGKNALIIIFTLVVAILTGFACGSADEDSEAVVDGDYNQNVDGDASWEDGDASPAVDGDAYAPDGDEYMEDGDASVDGDANVDGDMDMGEADTGEHSVADGDCEEGETAEEDGDNTEEDSTEEEGDVSDDPMANCPEEEIPYVMYLSSDDSNSVANPVMFRSMIEHGRTPFGQVRIWEFLNYYHVNYQAPSEEDMVAVYADMEETEEDGTFNLQVAARSYDVESRAGRSMNITFILDTSGSMSGTPIEYLREVCKVIAGQLNDGDVVSMVTWNTAQSTDLDGYEVSGPNDSGLLDAINSISASGGTDLHSGLVRGYQLANKHYSSDSLNRVILISDGNANVGITDANLIAQEADDSEGDGIYMVGVGVGNGYNDTLMDEVTDAGKGAYIFIDSKDEAQKMFGNRFFENMEVAVRDLQMEVTLPWYFQMKEFHGEEWSGDPTEVEPQHLAPNDAMVFHQSIMACWDELVELEDLIKVRANFVDPETREAKSVMQTYKMKELIAAGKERLLKGNAIVQYAQAIESVTRSKADRLETIEAARNMLNAGFERSNDADYKEMADTLNTLHSNLNW